MPNAFILTYNPAYWLWPLNERTSGRTIEWNVGNRRKGIEAGDHLFFLQQGEHQRGLIGHSLCLGHIYSDAHWLGPQGRAAQYVQTSITNAYPEPIIDLAELKFAAPLTNWSPRQSGAAINKHDAPEILALWHDATYHHTQGS